MCGRMRGDRRGQLALMDAVVFFSIAMLVSGIIVIHSGTVLRGEAIISDDASTRTEEMLHVLLASSIGERMSIALVPELTIAGHETISECLSAELYALTCGADTTAFARLNEAVASAIRAMCGPAMSACLLVLGPDGSSESVLLAIPRLCEPDMLAYSSSFGLPCAGGLLFTVCLVLEPAAFPELVQV